MSTHASSQTQHEAVNPVSLAVVQAVAAKTGRDPAALPPLYNWIDPDALDSLFAPSQTNDRRDGTIEFTYDGSLVAIAFDDNRTITVGETDQ